MGAAGEKGSWLVLEVQHHMWWEKHPRSLLQPWLCCLEACWAPHNLCSGASGPNLPLGPLVSHVVLPAPADGDLGLHHTSPAPHSQHRLPQQLRE